jgi:beta-phosphoglucomutase family hydrolase
VIFDLDGVIVDSSLAHRDSWMRLAGEASLPLDEAMFWETFGLRGDVLLGRLLGSRASDDEVRRLALRKEEIFRGLARGRLRALPGAADCVRSVRRAGHRVGLASSAPRLNIEMILDELALADAFEVIVSGDDVRRGKPDPEIFLTAASRLDVAPQRAVIVEDAAAGIAAARSAGMIAVAVSREDPPPGLRAADLVIATLEELSPALLAGLLYLRNPGSGA